MERSAWPKSLSSSRKHEIQELRGQNPKKLRDAFDAHSQTGDDPRQPLFAGDPILSVLGSFSSNTQSLSSGSESYEVFQVPSNAFVSSEVSKGSESVKSPVQRSPVESVKPPVQRSSFSSNTQSLSSGSESYEVLQVPSDAFVSSEVSEGSESIMFPLESVKTSVQSLPVESVKIPVRRLQRSSVESVKTHVQWSPVSILWEQPLVEAATAIYEGRVDVASEILTRLSAEILARLSAVPNPVGYSEWKLMGYMISALKSRMSPVDYPPPVEELFTEEHVSSVRSLYDLSPCFKLSFRAANLAILEAVSEQPTTGKLHVIDFDIGWEGQYIHLLDRLSMRKTYGKFTIKITALVDSLYREKRLTMLGDGLSDLVARRGYRFVFNIVRKKLSELSRDSLGCEPDEVLAVNLAFKLYTMPDESESVENPRDKLLQRVKGLAPRVVTLVEQEMNGKTAPFPMRVGEALAYYGALLESFESEFLEDGSKRGKAEEGLSRKLGNWVACEGRDRVERCEVFGEWGARMGMAGFELKPLGRQLAAMKALLHCWPSPWDPRFTVKEENGGFCFGWRGQTLTVASAWH